jgi:hemerythrin superfamily protein
MNANELLKKQHREVELKYEKFLDATGEAQEKIAQDMLSDLTAHSLTEEEMYYPELEDAGETSAVEEYRAEHESAKTLISKLAAMDADDDAFMPTMKALMEEIIHHAHEEELEGMPKMAEILGEQKLNALGSKMEARFKELKESSLKRFWANIT